MDFDQPNTITSILRFKPRKLPPYKNIFQIIRIANDLPAHVLSECWKIVEKPSNVVYLPINSRFIDEIIFEITDQDRDLINFKEELITIILHLKRVSYNRKMVLRYKFPKVLQHNPGQGRLVAVES